MSVAIKIGFKLVVVLREKQCADVVVDGGKKTEAKESDSSLWDIAQARL